MAKKEGAQWCRQAERKAQKQAATKSRNVEREREIRKGKKTSTLISAGDEHGDGDDEVEGDEGEAQVVHGMYEADDLGLEGLDAAHVVEAPTARRQESLLVQHSECVG
ncbi:hypothetical protein GOP47_0014053 [Adiantum capillus-veneris]|uniref:Uncharacterized protein n=1 Tax=Adiantum capillus-veneris TaxID=13818 RepID=A0A9D4UQN7_ADICA|nr:hypothetical protein GOP47_0014053 [Adiantum capillus-veneris]